MYILLLIVQVLLAVGLIVLILLQQGKGADAGAAFGSGASSTVFGSRGAGNFMSRTSAILATLFFANSLLLSTPFVIGDQVVSKSLTERVAPAKPAAPDEAPAADVPAPNDARESELPPAAPPTDSAAPADVPDVPVAPTGGQSDLP